MNGFPKRHGREIRRRDQARLAKVKSKASISRAIRAFVVCPLSASINNSADRWNGKARRRRASSSRRRRRSLLAGRSLIARSSLILLFVLPFKDFGDPSGRRDVIDWDRPSSIRREYDARFLSTWIPVLDKRFAITLASTRKRIDRGWAATSAVSRCESTSETLDGNASLRQRAGQALRVWFLSSLPRVFVNFMSIAMQNVCTCNRSDGRNVRGRWNELICSAEENVKWSDYGVHYSVRRF